MLTKEYRICLPMTVEEYRIAQLYMIQRKSREESSGAGSGVEILVNEPYEDGPGGKGQYTHKIYHIGSHLPGWFRAILPKSALMVEEEAWNAYPYTKTIYRCPFIEKFNLEIETKYLNDGGETENVFSQTKSELRNSTIDYLDIVKDPISSGDYKHEEDPKIYCSEKTGRGPLTEAWREEYTIANKNPEDSRKIMCAYKLCKVEFRYWGMQSKIERFIHDVGLRKTMLRAHRQAWAWQDEYYGLTLEDIRALERETQLALQEKMAKALEEERGITTTSAVMPSNENTNMENRTSEKDANDNNNDLQQQQINSSRDQSMIKAVTKVNGLPQSGSQTSTVNYNKDSFSPSFVSPSVNNSHQNQGLSMDSKTVQSKDTVTVVSQSSDLSPSRELSTHKKSADMKGSMSNMGINRKQSWSSTRSRISGFSGNLSEWKLGSIERLQTSSSDEDEFFDAHDSIDDIDFEDTTDAATAEPKGNLLKSSSMEMIATVGTNTLLQQTYASTDDSTSPLDRRLEQYQRLQSGTSALSSGSEASGVLNPYLAGPGACKTTILFIVLHGGSVMDVGQDQSVSKHADVSTLKTTINNVIKAHYPTLQGHVAFRIIPCPCICTDTLNLLSNLNPYNFENTTPTLDKAVVANDQFPLSAVPIFATGAPEYCEAVLTSIQKMNSVYQEFIRSEEGHGFSGQVCLLADSVGSIIAYDALCKNNPFLIPPYASTTYGSHLGSNEALHETDQSDSDHVTKIGNANPGSSGLEPVKQVSLSNPDLTITEATPVKPSRDSTFMDSNGSVTPPKHHDPSKQLQTPAQKPSYRHALSCPVSRRTSSGSQCSELPKFDFEVCDLFMFGSPLALVLAYRKLSIQGDKHIPRTQYLDPLAALIGSQLSSQNTNTIPKPSCHQIYNLFYPSDPSALRLEPLIVEKFKHVPTVKVARYQKFPLGDGNPVHIVETVQSNLALFSEAQPMPSPTCRSDSTQSHDYYNGGNAYERRSSNMSVMSNMSGMWDGTLASVATVTSRWWGNKRLDYALYCPDALQSFPSTALPYLLHASFWESLDAAAFILRQVVRQDLALATDANAISSITFTPRNPREKWLKRRTTIKLRNVAPNHRANDIIILEDKVQLLTARFMYGPLDMVSLTGEKVDIHIMKNPPSGEWTYFGTEITDSNGRATFRIPDENRLPQGMYPVKMIVRGDHTSVDFYLTVLPPKTESVVFSIDGSFTASVSIMGKDPKVRPGAVDVVRHWQDLGYLIVYVSARPDMQQKKVTAWLAQHNFPHGMVAFMDGLSADPLKQKTNFLRNLVQESDLVIRGAYGSSKDIAVYQNVALKAEDIYVVGKVSKKQYKEAVVLVEGYAAHLEDLNSAGASRPASGNARLFLRKCCFSLPGQNTKLSAKKSVRKTHSMPMKGSKREAPHNRNRHELKIGVSQSGNTVVEPASGISELAVKARGNSPRGKWMPQTRHDSSHV